MSTQRSRALRSLAEDPGQARVRQITVMLETQILHADKQLLAVFDDPDASEADQMMWRSRRHTLIEVWEFCSNRVWRLSGVDS